MKFLSLFRGRARGFTLIEMMVAMFVFAVIGGIAIDFFVSSVLVQRNTLAKQELLSQISYAAEYMSRALRQAQKELQDPALCLTRVGRGFNYELSLAGDGVKFIGSQNQCREFFLQNGQIAERVNGGAPVNLTPGTMTIRQLHFIARGESQSDNLQPRILFFIDAATNGQRSEEKAEIRLQTTVSQRQYDVPQ